MENLDLVAAVEVGPISRFVALIEAEKCVTYTCAIVGDGRLLAAWNHGGVPPLVAMLPPESDGSGVPESVAAAEEAHLVWRWMTRPGVRIADASGPLSLPSRPVPELL